MPNKVPSKEDIEDMKLGAEMVDLLNSPGWKHFERLLKKHIEEKTAQALTPVHPQITPEGQVIHTDGLAMVLFGEAAKGAILGMRFALGLPSGIVLSSQALREKYSPSAE